MKSRKKIIVFLILINPDYHTGNKGGLTSPDGNEINNCHGRDNYTAGCDGGVADTDGDPDSDPDDGDCVVG